MVETRQRPADDPNSTAKHAIALIEQRLKDEFGVRVKMGIELEFAIHFKPGAPVLKDDAGKIEMDPLRLGRDKLGNLFTDSNFVQYVYREPQYGPLLRVYEAVTQHDHPMPIASLPNAIEQLRRELEGSTPIHTAEPTIETKYGRAHLDRLLANEWHSKNVDRVSFSGDGFLSALGMHLNVSLADAQTGEPLSLTRDAPLNQSLLATTKHIFSSSSNLIAHAPIQQQRWRQMLAMDKEPSVQLHTLKATGDLKRTYLENKSPGSDCNAYYAVLMQMVAVYQGLLQERHQAPLESLEITLNAVERNLGTQFLAEVAAQPDSHLWQSGASAVQRHR